MKKFFTLNLFFLLLIIFGCKEEYSYQYNARYNYSGPPPDNKIYFMEIADSEITTNFIIHYTVSNINNNQNIYENNTYLFFGTKKGTFYNFDYRKGQFKWIRNFKYPIETTPSVYKDIVFFSTKNGNIYALDINTGNTKWEYKVNSETLNDSLITEKSIYFSFKNNKIYSFNFGNGSINWIYTSNLPIETNILSYNKRLYFGVSNSIYCIDENNGKTIWKFNSNGKILSMPVATNKKIFFVSSDNNLYCVNSEDSTFIWSVEIEKLSKSTPSINTNRNRIYVYSNKKILYIDTKSGIIVRETKIDSEIDNPIINLNGYIFVTDKNGRLYYIDETNQEIKWYFDGFGKNTTAPLIYNGIVHFGTDEGIIYAIGRNEDYHIYNPLIKKVNDIIKNRKGINQHRAFYNYSFGKIPQGYLKYKIDLNEEITNSISLENDDLYISSGNKLYTIKEDSDFIKWNYEASSKITSSVFVSNRIILFADKEGYVYSMHADYKQVNWRYNSNSSINSSPFSSQDKIFIGNNNGELIAIDNLGNLIWKYKTNGQINFDPIVYKDYVYFGSNDSYLYCLNVNTGKLAWKYNIKTTSKSCVIADNKVYISSEKDLLSLDYLSGKIIWKYETKAIINSIPAVYKNNVYFANQDGILFALNNKGQKLWDYKIKSDVKGGISIVDDYIYFGDVKGTVYSINYKDGKKNWEFDTKNKIITTPIIVKGLVYICSGKYLYVIS